jgi:hypothetical protein
MGIVFVRYVAQHTFRKRCSQFEEAFMIIANLTRYDIGGDSCDCGQSRNLGMEPSKDGDYVKFEEAVEASSNSLQQLKAEIALLLNTWDNTTKQQFLDTWVLRINKLRQLSAV